MRKYIIAMTIFGLAMLLGTNTAFAGGGSDSSGEGDHCYGFWSLPGQTFAQARFSVTLYPCVRLAMPVGTHGNRSPMI